MHAKIFNTSHISHSSFYCCIYSQINYTSASPSLSLLPYLLPFSLTHTHTQHTRSSLAWPSAQHLHVLYCRKQDYHGLIRSIHSKKCVCTQPLHVPISGCPIHIFTHVATYHPALAVLYTCAQYVRKHLALPTLS